LPVVVRGNKAEISILQRAIVALELTIASWLSPQRYMLVSDQLGFRLAEISLLRFLMRLT
jgi:hypothetical protein